MTPPAAQHSPKIHHSVVRVHETQVYLRATNPAKSEGPALCWIHGLGESALCFEPLLRHPRLAGYRQLALDLPGYGKSPHLEQAKTLPELATLIALWLEQDHPEPVVVIGHSMGGVLGQLLCEQNPERLAGFLNVEGNQSLGDCGFSNRANALSREEFLSLGFEKLNHQLFEEARTDPALEAYHRSLGMCDPRAFHLNSTELVSLSNSEQLARRMGLLSVPTHYIFGDPGGAGERSQELLKQASVTVSGVEPAGHWPFFDQPEIFLDQLLGFLSRHHSEG